MRPININTVLQQFVWRTGSTRIAACIAVFSVVALATACNPKAIPTVIFPAKPTPEPPAVKVTQPAIVTVNIFARDNVNPDGNGAPSPVQIRVYLATDQSLFEGIGFEQVFEFNENKFDLKPKLIKTVRPWLSYQHRIRDS